MKKRLSISKPLLDFEGQPMKMGDAPATLKKCLLSYVRQAHAMPGLTPAEQGSAYEAACLIGTAEEKVDLTQEQWNAIKKIADDGKFKIPGDPQPQPLFTLEVSQQIRRLVDGAETIET